MKAVILITVTFLLALILIFIQRVSCFDSSNIVFIIVSQKDQYHAKIAKELKLNIEDQFQASGWEKPSIHITHEDFPMPGGWTILPLLRPIRVRYRGSYVRWCIFLEPHTSVHCRKLVGALAAADKNKETMWLGYPLSDTEPTIVHHFTSYPELEEDGGFVYPYFASGFAMRMDLIDLLLQKLAKNPSKSGKEHDIKDRFSIDPAFELAQLIYGQAGDPGPLLTPDPSFCVEPAEICATYPKPFHACGTAIPERSIYFAVKTWSGYHETRVKVVKKTWGRHVTNLLFFSDKTDPSLPSIDTGIPNAPAGHCLKTVTILKMALDRIKDMPHIQWIFLADDDTILGVQRLTEILTCYRGGSDMTMLGERFGYGQKTSALDGYDYITLGGGAALSAGAGGALAGCACAAAAPDDMALGLCARARNLSLTHSPLFHQYRPLDYPPAVLARSRPVSFHGHSWPDPVSVYATWFQHADRALGHRKDEL